MEKQSQFPIGVADDEQLELRLGPPRERLWLAMDSNDEKRCKRDTWNELHQSNASYLQSSDAKELKCPDKVSPSPHGAIGTNSYNKSVAPSSAAVVGWPPIRSFRKKLTVISRSKPVSNSDINVPGEEGSEKPLNRNDLFVKINMEGVPIGRKINLNAYGSYDQLSVAINRLFCGLVAASKENHVVKETKANEVAEARNDEKYTLVYEDNEGDRILAGDVPWDMFVSTAKRLRVLKSSEPSLPQTCEYGREAKE